MGKIEKEKIQKLILNIKEKDLDNSLANSPNNKFNFNI